MTIVPGFEQLKARLRPGQYLRARILYSVDQQRFLLRLLGKTVVASSSERLSSGQDIWVRVRSVSDKIHLSLLHLQSSAAPPGPTDGGRELPTALSNSAFVYVDGRGEPIRVAVRQLERRNERQAWSIVLSLDGDPATSLRFVLDGQSRLLTVRLVSASAELVRSFLQGRETIERIAATAGFSRVRVGGKHSTSDSDIGSEPSSFGVDVVV